MMNSGVTVAGAVRIGDRCPGKRPGDGTGSDLKDRDEGET